MQKRTLGYSVAIAAMLVGGLGSAAFADRMRDGGPMGMMMQGPFGGPGFDFDAVDADKDGKITPEEFKAHRAAAMAAVDADADGKITADELVAHHLKQAEARARTMAPEMLKDLDADGDGAVTVTELQASGPQLRAKMLRRIDTDGDGAVSKAELAAMQARMAEGRGKPGHGHGKPGPGKSGQDMPEGGN